LITSPIFHPVASPLNPPSGSAAPFAPQKQPPNSPPSTATIPPSHNLALISPSAYFYDDHYAGTGSPPLELHLSKFTTTASTDSAAGSSSSAAANTGSLTDSSTGL